MRNLSASRRVAIVAALFLLCLSFNDAQAAPGNLDTTFGSGGVVITPIGSSTDDGQAVAIQSDGKIVTAGFSFNGSFYDFALVRYNASGTLDTTFNGTGKVTTTIGSNALAYAVAIQPDGKIVVAGYSVSSTADFALVRYNTNGTLDTTFNGTGTVTTSIGSSDDIAYAVTIQPDGKIVAAGYIYNGTDYDIALIRYNTDGTLDTSFNGTGKVTTVIGSSNEQAYAVTIQPDGKIVAAGYSIVGTSIDFALVRYNTDSSLDTTFNGTGKVTTAIGVSGEVAYAVAIQPDGKIVAAGYSTSGVNSLFALVRYNPNGSLDTSFNGTGKVTTPIGSSTNVARAVAIQPNGKIVAAGYGTSSGVTFLAAARYNSNGTLDTSFNGTGKVATNSVGNNFTEAFGTAIQPDGRIIVAGYTFNGSNDDFFVLRYQGDTTAVPGNPDVSFNGTGTAITTIGSDNDYAYAVAVQPDGKTVAAGYIYNGTNGDFALARYNVNGTLDTTFNGTGRRIDAIGGGNDIGQAMALQSDGKIVVAGYSYNGSNYDFALIRYNSNGTLDTTLTGGTGKVTTPIGSGDDAPYAVVIQPDGKIVVAGQSSTGGNADFALVRYNTNGTLDTTFNTTGKVVTPIGGGNDVAYTIALQSDNKIVVAGVSHNGANYDIALVRYNTTGTLDTTFNGSGKVVTPIGSGDDFAQAVAIQPDGKIVAAGNSTTGTNTDFAVVRYNTGGTLDATFNGTGKATVDMSGTNDNARAVAIQPNGKILVGGYSNISNTSVYNFGLARYNQDGTLDNSFGEGGIINHDLGSGDDEMYGMVLRPNGRIVTAGWYFNGSNTDFAVARYHTDQHAHSDFDGDNRSDIAVWNPTTRNWDIRQSRSNTDRVQLDWGSISYGDIAAPGDYDGDNRTDIAVWRPSDGDFYIIKSSDGSVIVRNWGGSNDDTPIPADYDGDGKTDYAIFRKSEGNWYIINSATNTLTVHGWGVSTDQLVPADYDGDGRADIAVYRPSEGNWYILNSATNTVTVKNWGTSGDKVVPADYDGDGRTDIAIFRPSEGNWYIIQSNTNTVKVKSWGNSGDTLVPGDYDLDGKADIAIFRPAEGNWYIINSSTNAATIIYLGGFGDVPISNAYLPQ